VMMVMFAFNVALLRTMNIFLGIPFPEQITTDNDYS
jgi:hypothetical protein